MSTHIWEVAERYACDFHVVKLRPWTNMPFEKQWQLNRMTPTEAKDAWARWPQMNIGVVAWPNFWVLDLDGPEAVAWFEALALRHGGKPETLTIKTPGRNGGKHLWWQAEGLSKRWLRQHLAGCTQAEVKFGPGRQTAVPPSRRFEGAYKFDVAVAPAPTPPWLADRLIKDERSTHEEPKLGWLSDLAREDSTWGRCAELAVSGLVKSAITQMGSASEGSRNSTLFWTARSLLEVGLEDLTGLAQAARASGLDDSEIDRTIQSAKKATR